MVKTGRHHYIESVGDAQTCARCPLPEANEIHQVWELDDDQRAAERRRVGEGREEG